MRTPSRRDRIGYLLVAAGSTTVLILARALTPSPSGVGTHEQLGLPPCAFHALTGHGCPGCGLTTAFAHLARGEVGAALDANPLALLLFAIAAMLIPFSLYRAWRPVPLERYIETPLALVALGLLTAAMFLTWLLRLALGLI